uniref:Tail protein n=1 Tax=viral metagenome TaxID=1070528 RepID=A0A6M3J732_9ZZZZ
MSVLDLYSPKILITISGTSTYKFSNEDIFINSTLYEGELVNSPDISKELNDVYWGVARPQSITLQMNNARGRFTGILSSGEELRNKTVTIQKYEALDTTAIEFEISGSIREWNCGDIFTISISDLDPFQKILPSKTFQTTDLSLTATNIPADDLGRPYNIVLGSAKKVPLVYINQDRASSFFDYLIGYGTVDTSTYIIYRDQVIVSTSEYTIYGGSQGSPYPGYAFIRFTNEQLTYNPQTHYGFTADIEGLKLGADATATRNPAKQIEHLLSNSVWGLGLTVDTTVFAAATADVAAIVDIYTDGVISEQRTAQDILDNLLKICKGRLEKTSEGKWGLYIDKHNSTVAAIFGSGDGFYENIISINRYGKTPTNEAVKSYTMNYSPDNWTNEFQYQAKRTVLAFGEDVVEDNPFVRNSTTADKHAAYVSALQTIGDTKLSIKVGMEGRNLGIGDIITATVPRLGISGNYKVQAINKRLTEFDLNCYSYSSAIFTYSSASLPNVANPSDGADYSKTPPGAPTGIAIDSQGVSTASDGGMLAWGVIKATRPASNALFVRFGKRKNGETVYSFTDGSTTTTALEYKARFDALVPNVGYDYIAESVNVFGLISTASTTLTNQVALNDTVAPGQVVGLAGYGKLKTWSFNWTPSTESDIRGYHIQIADSSAFSTILIDNMTSADQEPHGSNRYEYTNDAIAYGVVHARVKGVDFSKNQSAAWSVISSAITTPATSTDIGSLAIGSSHYQVASIQANHMVIGSGVNICHPRYCDFEETTLPPMICANGTYAISSTAYFGNQALKLISSSADNWCVFGGTTDLYKNVQISPNRIWMVSAYVRANGVSKGGSFFLITQETSNNYADTFTTPATANKWARVYKTFNLSADTAKRCLLRMDNDDNGVEMTIDGIQIEEVGGTSTSIVPSAWSMPGQTIISGDQIQTGVLKIVDGSVCYSAFGGDSSGVRDGQAHFYSTAGVEMCNIGKSTLGGDYWVQKIDNNAVGVYGGLYVNAMGGGILINATHATAAWALNCYCPSGFAINVAGGGLCLNGQTVSTAASTGYYPIPASVQGYLDLVINSCMVKIPYFK